MPISDFALDKFVAPKMSEFASAIIPDMSAHDPMQNYWLVNFILNSMLRVNVAQPVRAWTFAFLRYAQASFDEYDLARQFATEYLADASRQNIRAYLRAIYHFEGFVAQTDNARRAASQMCGSERFFEKKDGSALERLNFLHNKSKHAENAIKNGELPSDTTMVLWLSNSGLCHSEAVLEYDEMVNILGDLAIAANAVSNPPLPSDRIVPPAR